MALYWKSPTCTNHAYFLLPPSTWVKRKHIRIHRWLIVKKRLPSPSSTHTILTFCVHCLYMQAKVDDRSFPELLIESNDYQLYSRFKNQVKCLGCIFGGFLTDLTFFDGKMKAFMLASKIRPIIMQDWGVSKNIGQTHWSRNNFCVFNNKWVMPLMHYYYNQYFCG